MAASISVMGHDFDRRNEAADDAAHLLLPRTTGRYYPDRKRPKRLFIYCRSSKIDPTCQKYIESIK